LLPVAGVSTKTLLKVCTEVIAESAMASPKVPPTVLSEQVAVAPIALATLATKALSLFPEEVMVALI
jgi:hypothetical protein